MDVDSPAARAEAQRINREERQRMNAVEEGRRFELYSRLLNQRQINSPHFLPGIVYTIDEEMSQDLERIYNDMLDSVPLSSRDMTNLCEFIGVMTREALDNSDIGQPGGTNVKKAFERVTENIKRLEDRVSITVEQPDSYFMLERALDAQALEEQRDQLEILVKTMKNLNKVKSDIAELGLSYALIELCKKYAIIPEVSDIVTPENLKLFHDIMMALRFRAVKAIPNAEPLVNLGISQYSPERKFLAAWHSTTTVYGQKTFLRANESSDIRGPPPRFNALLRTRAYADAPAVHNPLQDEVELVNSIILAGFQPENFGKVYNYVFNGCVKHMLSIWSGANRCEKSLTLSDLVTITDILAGSPRESMVVREQLYSKAAEADEESD
jgi:hypothetical protein